MSTGLGIFDTTFQETNIWLKELEAELKPCDRQNAYAALRAVLHVLRDRLPADGVLGISAQLPLLVRGIFFEGWTPMAGPTNIRDPQQFADQVAMGLPPGFPRESAAAVKAVFKVMVHHLDPGEIHKLMGYLPEPLRAFWPAGYAAA